MLKILENNGFEVAKEGGQWSVHQYTPEGEDWWLYFDKLSEIVEYADNYSPEDDFTMWVEAKYNGMGGVPDIPELWKDQLWKRDILNKVAMEYRATKKIKKSIDK